MFDHNLFKKRGRDPVPSGVLSANLLRDKGKHVKGTITVAHCKGHDCIMFFFLKIFMRTTETISLKHF